MSTNKPGPKAKIKYSKVEFQHQHYLWNPDDGVSILFNHGDDKCTISLDPNHDLINVFHHRTERKFDIPFTDVMQMVREE